MYRFFYLQKTVIFDKGLDAQIPEGYFLKCDVHRQKRTTPKRFVSSGFCATIVVIQMPTQPESNNTYPMVLCWLKHPLFRANRNDTKFLWESIWSNVMRLANRTCPRSRVGSSKQVVGSNKRATPLATSKLEWPETRIILIMFMISRSPVQLMGCFLKRLNIIKIALTKNKETISCSQCSNREKTYPAVNEGFNEKIIYIRWVFHVHVWLWEGSKI